MTSLWIAIISLSLGALGLILYPLVRRRPPTAPGRADYDITVYKDQLAEIDRDLERDLMSPAQAVEARTEVKRRMLAAAPGGDRDDPDRPVPGGRFAVVAVIAVLVPLGAVLLYLDLGSPGTPDFPYAGRDAAARTAAATAAGITPEQRTEVEDIVARLAERLIGEPEDLKGWLLLGRSYVSLGRFTAAAGAYKNAAKMDKGNPDIAAELAETLVLAARSSVTPEAREIFRTVLAADPFNLKGRYYLALDKAQRGDVKGALQGWVDMLAVSPAGAPWLSELQEQIGQAASDLGVDPASVEPSPEALELAKKRPPPG